eukprot:Phypoly_transcript_12720.p1 GENE.Phypoly_transcript_12720~~Phypoly_transcript_12720.p1  ORF type:complete len:132 (+),score=1.94 Phypoly_transcript_12720:314-709(+)
MRKFFSLCYVLASLDFGPSPFPSSLPWASSLFLYGFSYAPLPSCLVPPVAAVLFCGVSLSTKVATWLDCASCAHQKRPASYELRTCLDTYDLQIPCATNGLRPCSSPSLLLCCPFRTVFEISHNSKSPRRC